MPNSDYNYNDPQRISRLESQVGELRRLVGILAGAHNKAIADRGGPIIINGFFNTSEQEEERLAVLNTGEPNIYARPEAQERVPWNKGE